MSGRDEGTLHHRAKEWLREAMGLSGTAVPFPWQEDLLGRFLRGTIEPLVDIPTGLGKTAVMAIWLVARACGASLPRRLVYVVDRRAVVDQATDEAVRLREYVERTPELQVALGLQARPLPISTLRGQHVDNREWLENPALPAIIVATVDMIGSRLLFEGYGTSRKMRPYHAGLLGADTLVLLDEAHLVPPFEGLLDAIVNGSAQFGPRHDTDREVLPPFKLMSLSATGRVSGSETFGLTEKDLEPGSIVRKRLDAPKRLTFVTVPTGGKLPDALAEQAWKLTGQGNLPLRCVVFCDRRTNAVATKTALEKLAKGTVTPELLVGARRVFERQAASECLRKLGFLAGSDAQLEQPAFLIATAAGEVGIDLDADHMVGDLVAWERMVQRLGRVNRRGDGNAQVVVLNQESPPEKEREMLAAYDAALRRLPSREDEGLDASPGAIRNLKRQSETDPALRQILEAATTPPPLRPALTRAVVDAWSMTSLKEHTGRPDIGPWLRGWELEEPQTTVAWRRYLPVRAEATDRETRDFIEKFFEAAPPHMSELLETETYHVAEWLSKRGEKLRRSSLIRPQTLLSEDEQGAEGTDTEPEIRTLQDSDVAAIVLTPSGDLMQPLNLQDFERLKSRDIWKQILPGMTVVVDARVKGLTLDGLLDGDADDPPRTVDDGEKWLPDVETSSGELAPVVRFRVAVESDEPPGTNLGAQWRERARFALDASEEGEEIRWLVVYKWRYDGTTEDDRSVSRPQLLDTHEEWTERRVRDIARRLGLPEPYVEMLATAARLHDEGKRAAVWKRAAGVANAQDDYGKTLRVDAKSLHGYRHEFGSVLRVKDHPRLAALPPDLRDLALHLIAAHHGWARPVISTDECDGGPKAILEEQAAEVALRFARLQKRWGPWGLAWWESLLRAADQQASRENDEADTTGKENT